MGCFGYICKGCNSAIIGDCFSGGEKTIMIHVRHGVELGRVEGHYDEYGRVIEQKTLPENEKFRGNGGSVNSHDEICVSEFDLEDSHHEALRQRLYNGNECSYDDYLFELVMEELDKHEDIRKSELFDYVSDDYKAQIEALYADEKDEAKRKAKIDMCFSFGIRCMNEENQEEMKEQFSNLPIVKKDKYSGLAAWHSKCYHEAPKEKQEDLTPSLFDPNQSWGKVRKKFV